MKSRKTIAFEDRNPGATLGQERSGGRPRRPSSDDHNIVVFIHAIEAWRPVIGHRFFLDPGRQRNP